MCKGGNFQTVNPRRKNLKVVSVLRTSPYKHYITCNKVANAVKQCSIHFLSVEL